jgi:uncharacterized protein YggE
LGELIELSTNGSAAPPQPYRMEALAGKTPTPIETGELGLSVGIMARWRLLTAAK